MKKTFYLALTLLITSCSSQTHKNVQCMEFFDEAGVEWFSSSKKEEYQEVISELQDNNLAITKVDLTDSKADLYNQLERLGFSKTNTYLTEKKMHKVNEMGEKIPMVKFEHQDGSVVRVKPIQDMSNKFHPYPHYVLSVKDETCEGEFNCETVKLGRFGYIFPKHPNDFRKGVSKQDLKCWGDATHIRLNK